MSVTLPSQTFDDCTITRQQYRQQENTMGSVHDLIGDEYDVVTGERNDYPPPARCDHCGNPYVRKRKDQRFCSPGCSKKWHTAHPAPRTTRTPTRRRPQGGVTALPVPVGASHTDDLPGLLAQILAAAGEWRLEARLGDVQLVLMRPVQ